MDRVQVMKQEWSSLGGDAADQSSRPLPIEPQEDAIEAAGLYVQNATDRDENVLLSRSGNDLILRDENAGPISLSGLLGDGRTTFDETYTDSSFHYPFSLTLDENSTYLFEAIFVSKYPGAVEYHEGWFALIASGFRITGNAYYVSQTTDLSVVNDPNISATFEASGSAIRLKVRNLTSPYNLRWVGKVRVVKVT